MVDGEGAVFVVGGEFLGVVRGGVCWVGEMYGEVRVVRG